jgi:uncharacterized protein (TIGR00661 family)
MKVLFVVQGEGRGHMTQALALRHVLESAGHELVSVCVGTSDRRRLPGFFVDKIGAPVTRHRSPNFVTDEENKGILVGRSIWTNLLKTDEYLRSLADMNRAIENSKPDLVVNFYEPLWGLYQLRHPGKVPSVCVAHQMLAGHQDFPFPEGRATEKAMLLTLNRIAANGSSRLLGLSFTPMAELRDDRLVVVPPLLRPALGQLQPVDGDFLLVYVMQSGYGADIISWHEKNPGIELHCFWDRQDAPETDHYAPNLTFHQLSDVKFLEMMAACRGLVTTAGFESVCEAMYLGKPVFMVPVEGHYEQACNALDAKRAGAGIWSDRFDLDAFIDYLPGHTLDPLPFRTWSDEAGARILSELEAVLA